MRRLSIQIWLRALALAMGMLLAAALVLNLAGCGGAQNEASSVRLARHEGELAIQDGQQKELAPAADMALYSGYRLATGPAGYGWLALDESRLAKLDESSKLALQKEGRALTLELESGSLFFNIEKPLAQDESLTIRSSEMTVGIRGTCGWVGAGLKVLYLYLLKGEVEVSLPAADGSVLRETVTAGQCAILREDDGSIEVSGFYEDEIPAFVLEEVEGPLLDEARESLIPEGPDDSGGQGENGPAPAENPPWADELLAGLAEDGVRVAGSRWVDFAGDGNPMLLVSLQREGAAGDAISCTFEVYASGGAFESYNGEPWLVGSDSFGVEPGWPVQLAQRDGQCYLFSSITGGSQGERNYSISGLVWDEALHQQVWRAVDWIVVSDQGGYNAVAAHDPDGSVAFGENTLIECGNAEAHAALDRYAILGTVAANEGGQLVCPAG